MDEQMTWAPKSSNDILEHHGIKGQRWGVRRTPEQLGHKTGGKRKWRIRMKTSAERKEEQYQRKKAKLDAKDQALKRKEELRRQEDDIKRRREALKGDKKEPPKKTEVPKKRDVKDLSDDELRQILSRYNMEQQYAKMNKEQQAKGKSWVTQMLAEAGKDVAKQYTKKMMTAMIDAAVEKAKQNRRNNSGSSGSSGSGSGSS